MKKAIFLWIIGVLLLLISFSQLDEGAITRGFLFLTSSILVIPSTFNLINKKIGNRLDKGLRLFLIIALVISGIMFSPSSNTNTQEQPINEMGTQQTSTNETENIDSSQETNETKAKQDNTEESTEQNSFLVTRVIDGDTIELETGETVRYIGIDTPETYTSTECFGQEATNKNKELVENKHVKLEKDVSETDQYGRLLRYVYIGDIFVNDLLVREGYANASSYPPDVKYQDQLTSAETEARNNNRGLWGECVEPEPEPEPKPTCTWGQEISRSCHSCNYASVVKTNSDCSQFSKLEYDSSCSYLCAPEPEPESESQSSSESYSCSCSKICSEMSSCEEAYYQLNTCGCSIRDGDDDGVPCESICPGG